VTPGCGGFISILRAKAEDAGVPWIEVDPRHTSDGCEKCGYAAAETVSPQRHSNASDARIAPKQTNMPRATSYGLDWPFTPKRREKKPAASSRRRTQLIRRSVASTRGSGSPNRPLRLAGLDEDSSRMRDEGGRRPRCAHAARAAARDSGRR